MTAPFLNGLGESQEFLARRTIPFDQAFRYNLTGQRGTVLNQTITVSIEATFVAVSIGYGAIPPTDLPPITFGPKIPPPVVGVGALAPATLQSLSVGDLLEGLGQALQEDTNTLRGDFGPRTTAAIQSGFKLNPEFAQRVLLAAGTTPLDPRILANIFQVVAAPTAQIQFLYALFDEGSGREFQSEPILNIAGLGISNGDRPFRVLFRSELCGNTDALGGAHAGAAEFHDE